MSEAMLEEDLQEHPAFTRAKALSEPLRSHFPKTSEEARGFVPLVRIHALSMRVLAVANTRVECAWCAYCDAVPGMNHDEEARAVLDYGDKLSEEFARKLFPYFKDVPYAR